MSKTSDTGNDKAGDAAAKQVQKTVDEAEDKGYFGVKVDPLPNEAYSLESGPDSPTLEDVRKASEDVRKESEKK